MKILHHNIIAVSEDIDVNKACTSKEYIVWFYQYFYIKGLMGVTMY